MSSLPGFWHGAAALSGRIDLSTAIQSCSDIPSLSDADLFKMGVNKRAIQRLRSSQAVPGAGQFIVIGQRPYPTHLAQLPFSPPILFFQGNTDLMSQRSVAIVGARRCTQRGREMAIRLAKGLTNAGLTICSGLAYGIDEAAQMACPDRTIAVLGQGWNGSMSHRLKRCVNRIVDSGGLVLTEFLPHIPASKFTFPQRNRIISGLSSATIVVEAALRSGSQITARHALEQGRDVMAVPGHPTDTMSKGCNQLISQGAALIEGPIDALNLLGIKAIETNRPPPSCPIQKMTLQAMESGNTLDHLATITGQPVHALIVAIQSLELTGHIVRLPGDRFQIQALP